MNTITIHKTYWVTAVFSLCAYLCIVAGGKPSGQTGAGANGNNANQNQAVKEMCRKLCATGVCPPDCAEGYLDPWSSDDVDDKLTMVLGKRSPGIDGFTFDDYLFLRWLGRDMSRRRRYK